MKIRSGFSFHKSCGQLADVVSRVKELKWKEIPLCDNSAFGFVQLAKLAKDSNLRPIFGLEIRIGDNDRWAFFAKDKLRDLHELFAKQPLTYDQAMNAKDLIKIVGPNVNLSKIKPAADLYIGLSPALPKAQFNEAKARGFRFIATSENVYPRETDRDFYRIVLGKRASLSSYPQHILTDKEWLAAVGHLTDDKLLLKNAIDNRKKAMSQCHAQLKKAKLLIPDKPKSLKVLCQEGAKRLGVDVSQGEYLTRLMHELDVIKKMGNGDYFHIVSDLMQYARQNMMCGPGRGSSCGSLVCYLLGITTVDPLKYGLLFERFLDVTRTDSLPDIDSDFPDTKRYLIIEYLQTKYGEDRVAKLGTIGLFGARSGLNQIARSLNIPKWEVEEALSQLIIRADGDAGSSNTLIDTLSCTSPGQKFTANHPEVSAAARIEGNPNFGGCHASGVLVVSSPIADHTAVSDGVAQCDMHAAEELGALKFDCLGLQQLSIFERTIELIGSRSSVEARSSETLLKQSSNQNMINLQNIPLDDPKAFAVLNDGRFAGIFQFNGRALQGLTKQFTVSCLDDMVAITSLARPGPMDAGASERWVQRKIGKEEVSYHHPLFEPILKDTFGIVIYQEQVMRIAREIGDLSWADVNALRKAMGKSQGAEAFDAYGNKWKPAAIKKGISKEIADQAWNELLTFGRYGFNKSHAVAYSIISYQCCWLKAYYPIEFAAATLDAEADPDKQILLLKELAKEGINYIPVDIEHSTDRWRPVVKDGKKILVGPLTAIKGIGPAALMEIKQAREQGLPLRASLLKKLSEARTSIDTLSPISDAIKRICPDLKSKEIESEPLSIINAKSGQDALVIGVIKKIEQIDENSPDRVKRRNGREVFPKDAINIFVQDDTGDLFCKVHAKNFEHINPTLADAKAGKSIYAIEGSMSPYDFRMLWVYKAHYLGDMSE